ncbi:MAG: hypothetical protein C0606_02365 [Hyphomicrobiales bacterium]|nr:MAG: hypothetical protein C0606_02365 [Hyphomicrobiales bacterium]
MHHLTTTFVLGYHGCDESVAESLIAGKNFQNSANEYDWLGAGVYFWESNPRRGLEFANEAAKRNGSKIKKPAVIGAVIDLGYCLDLLSSAGVDAVAAAYESFLKLCEKNENRLPRNEVGEDLLLRKLDCAVINHLHYVREISDLAPFDAVRGVFLEGQRIYENSGFRSKTHIQLCVRNHESIKGVFRVPDEHLNAR